MVGYECNLVGQDKNEEKKGEESRVLVHSIYESVFYLARLLFLFYVFV